jgi:general secretion pathway protein G
MTRAGFTLIELLVVMIILAVLAAAVIPRVLNRTEEAKVSRAQSDIDSIKTALDHYKVDNGDYPTTDQGLEALRTMPQSDPIPKHWSGPYIKQYMDPWQNPYGYMSPGEHDPDYDIWSNGADGQQGGEGKNADIVSWETQETK